MSVVDINLEKQAYILGERAKGTVVVSTDSDLEIRSTKFLVTGTERTKISEWALSSEYSREMTYKESNTFFIKDLHIFLTKGIRKLLDDKEKHGFPKGTWVIPFEFTLPQDTLESYVGKHAWIEYKIEAVLDIQWKNDITKKVFFNVFAPRNRSSSIPTLYKTSYIKKEGGEEDSDMTKKKEKDTYAILDFHGQSTFYPGDTINGKVVIKNLQKIPRRAELTLSAIEQATAKGMRKTTARESHKQDIEIKEEQQQVILNQIICVVLPLAFHNQ